MYIFSIWKFCHHVFFLLKILFHYGDLPSSVPGCSSFWLEVRPFGELIEFSWISLFIYYATVPCLPEVFRCLPAWNSLLLMRRVRWPHRTIHNILAKPCPSQSTLPSRQQLSQMEFLTCRRRPSQRVRRVPCLMTRPVIFLLHHLSWQALLTWTGLIKFSCLLRSLMRTSFDAQAACLRPLHLRLRNLPLSTSRGTSSCYRRHFQGPFPLLRALTNIQELQFRRLVRENSFRTAVTSRLRIPGCGPVQAPLSLRFRRPWWFLVCRLHTLEPLGPSLLLWLTFLDLSLFWWRQDLQPKTPFPTPLRLARFFQVCHAPFPWDLRDLLRDLQYPPPRYQRLLLFLHHLRSLSRPPRSFQRLCRCCQTFKPGWRTCNTLFFISWKTRWWISWVLFLRGLGALTCCGHWAPLVTEHHHGLRISPGQSERTVAPGPGSLSSRNGWSHRRPYSLSSSSDHLSPPSKPLRTVSRSPWRCSRSPDVSRRSPGPQPHCASPSSTDPSPQPFPCFKSLVQDTSLPLSSSIPGWHDKETR